MNETFPHPEDRNARATEGAAMRKEDQSHEPWGSRDIDWCYEPPRQDLSPPNTRADVGKPESFQAYFPAGLMNQLRHRALADRTSVKALVLRALRDSGYLVPPEATRDRRKKTR